jgi:putative addiction module CopG family antidote
MTIHLKPELEALIEEEVQRGHYRSADEFVERAVHMLHECEQEAFTFDSEVNREKIERAFHQFEQGQGLTPEQSRAQLEDMKRDWLKQKCP